MHSFIQSSFGRLDENCFTEIQNYSISVYRNSPELQEFTVITGIPPNSSIPVCPKKIDLDLLQDAIRGGEDGQSMVNGDDKLLKPLAMFANR